MTKITEPVVGVRWWVTGRIAMNPLGLYSCFASNTDQPILWEDKTNHAVCCANRYTVLPRHACPISPGEHCFCGINAFYNATLSLGLSAAYAVSGVPGIVRGWGRMRLHPEGWRAEHAEIMAMLSLPSLRYGAPKVDPAPFAEAYGVPVIQFPSIHAADATLSEFGAEVPKDMRPPAPAWL